MALDSNLSNWKSAGTYRIEIDQSVVTNDQINVGNLRLIAGFSKQGPINKPILVTNPKQFTNLFGTIDRSLEKKGSYFHRTVLTALSSGPVLALNLLNLDPIKDQVPEQTFSVNTNNKNKDLVTLPLSGCYNSDKFWEADASSFGDTIDIWLGDKLKTTAETPNIYGYNKEILHFTNVGKKAISIIVKKSSPYNVQNFNMTLNDWYGVGNVPEYLNGTSLVSDYMVDVYVIEGNFGPQTTETELSVKDLDDDPQTNEKVKSYAVTSYDETLKSGGYSRFFSDVNYQKYFDKDGFIRKAKDTDTTDTNLTEFIQLPSVKLITTYTCSLIPNFVDKMGRNIWIQKLVNDDVNTTGLLCFENVDAIEDVAQRDEEGNIIENESGFINEKIDLVGHNIDLVKSDVNMLSYKCSLSDGSDSDTYSDIASAIKIITDSEEVLNPNEILIEKSNTDLAIGDYLVSVLKTDNRQGRLTRIIDITSSTDGKYKKVVCYDKIFTQDVDDETVVFKFKTIDSYCDHLQIICLQGYKIREGLLPDGTEKRQNEILDMLRSKDDVKYQGSQSNLYKALIDRDFISWRYLVDSFGLGLESSSKDVYTKLCQGRGSALAIINCPSQEDFKKSKTPNPSFVNEKGSVEAEYIAKGGNPSKASEFRYTLPVEKDGATYGAYYYPYIKIMDQSAVKTVPPAAYVSNLFLSKYDNGNPWTIVAGPRRGVITGNQSVGVEATLIHDNRDWLEPVGINSIIWQNGVGIEVYGNKTAKQSPISALSSVHVRESVIYIEDYIEEILRKYIFTENNAQTRLEIKTMVDNFLDSIVHNGGLYDFNTVMDTSNNTPDVIDNNHGVIDVYLEPVKGLEILTQRVTILRTGAIQSGQIE